MHYRGCSTEGLKFISNEHTVEYPGVTGKYEIHVRANAPDIFGQMVAFPSLEDKDEDPNAFGMWVILQPGQQPTRMASWRSAYPGRFAPDGHYFFSDKWEGGAGRGAYWTWRDGTLAGPFPSGTNDIEGISDFLFDGQRWTPVWMNRGKPVTIDGYKIVLWKQAGQWFYGQQGGEFNDRHLAKDPTGQWRLVTTSTSQVFPCPKQQPDGSLLVAWNGDKESFMTSTDNWPPLGPAKTSTNYYIDVTSSGLYARSTQDGSPSVIFGTDPPIVMPTHSNAFALHPGGESALVRGRNDRTYRVTRAGQITNLDSSVGTYNVGYSPAGVEYWIHTTKKYKAGGVEKDVPKDATGDYISGQGWTQIRDNGDPAWTGQVSPKTIDGKTLTRPVEKGDWIVGMETVDPGRILATNRATKEWFVVWTAYTPQGPTLAIVDGQPVVGISLPGVLVARELFTSYSAPPTTPDGPDIPTFGSTDQKIGIGMFDDQEGPRIIGYTENLTDNVRAIFVDSRDDKDDLDASLELADEIGWPVGFYKDAYGLDPDDVPEDARALVYAYPEADMSVEDSLKRVRDTLKDCTNEGVPADLCAAAYCQYKGPGNYSLSEQKVLDMLDGVWDLAKEFKVGAIWLFTKYRDAEINGVNTVVDGIDYWPSLQEAVKRLKNASGDWDNFPQLGEPDEPEHPEPDEPKFFFPLRSLL